MHGTTVLWRSGKETVRRFLLGLEPEQAGGQPEGIGSVAQIVGFLVLLLLIFSRRPSDLLHAQFYAEDGKLWFTEAYNATWVRALAIPVVGYLQTLPRLVAAITMHLPFRWAPLVMNLAGAAVQALAVTVLLSRRAATWGSLGTRALMAACYLGISDATEVHVVLTDAQWHLALVQILLAFSLPPATWRGRVMDVLVFGIGALSGPFDVALLPLLCFFWLRRRERWHLMVAGILLLGVSVQARFLLHAVRQPPGNLGATPERLMRLVSGDVLLNTLIGQSNVFHFPDALLLMLLVCASALIVVGLRVAPLGMRLLAVYAVILLAGGLKSPMIAGDKPLWALLIDQTGCRYYFFPSLAFMWLIVYCARRADSRTLRRIGSLTLVVVALGAVRKWEYTRWQGDPFPQDVQLFQQARPGQDVRLPIYPSGWDMVLRKH